MDTSLNLRRPQLIRQHCPVYHKSISMNMIKEINEKNLNLMNNPTKSSRGGNWYQWNFRNEWMNDHISIFNFIIIESVNSVLSYTFIF